MKHLASWVVASLLAFSAVSARASVIVHAPLEEVVDATELVLVGEIASYQETHAEDVLRGDYDVLLADQPGTRAHLVYTQPLPEVRGGATIAPRVTGSGLEHSVHIGRSYVFLVRAGDTDEALALLRIEPLEREPFVMSAWRMSLFRRMAKPIALPLADGDE